MLQKLSKIRIFSKLSVRIIALVFFITLTGMFVSSQVSTHFIKADAINNSKLFLGRLMDMFENELVNIGSVTTKLSSAIQEYGDLNELEDYYQRYKISKEIDRFEESNTYVNSVYIYFDEGRKVYFTSYKPGAQAIGIKNAEDFFDTGNYHEFISSGRLSAVIVNRRIISDYFDNPSANSSESRVMTIIKRLPANDLNSSDILMVNIEEKHMLKLVSENYMPWKSIVLITDRTGDVILSYSNDMDAEIDLNAEDIKKINGLEGQADNPGYSSLVINSVECYVVQVGSDIYSWKYTLIIPESGLLRPVTIMNIVVFAFFILALIIGGIFSILIDKKYFQPVLKILKLLKSKTTDREYPEFMQSETSGRKHKNNELNQLEGYVDSIILKSDKQEKQLQRYFSFYKERILLAILNGDSNLINMQNLDEIMSKKTQGRHCSILIKVMEKHAYYGDAAYDGQDSNMVISGIEDCLSAFGQTDKINIDRHRIVILLNLQANTDTVTLIESIQRILDAHTVKGLICNIAVGSQCNSFKGIRESFLVAEKALMYLTDDENSRVFDADGFTENAGNLMNKTGGENGEEYNEELINKIIKYIGEHYMDYNLGLNTIADYVYLSPSYLGRVFKEISGTTFTQYLIKIRMEAAADLLVNKNVNITDIVEKVGYNSIQSFGRSFRNYFKCSPSEYRRKAVSGFFAGK